MTLSELRRTKKISMTQLAAQLGISQGHLSNIEHGKRSITDQLVDKIAVILGESIDPVSVTAPRNDGAHLRSWLGYVRINGLPLANAFACHLETRLGAKVTSLDDAALKQELKEYVESNIGFAVVAEVAQNRGLLPSLRLHLGQSAAPLQPINDHEQLSGIL